MTDPAPADPGLRCPYCGSAVAADAAFCEACGKPLTPTGLARGSRGSPPSLINACSSPMIWRRRSS